MRMRNLVWYHEVTWKPFANCVEFYKSVTFHLENFQRFVNWGFLNCFGGTFFLKVHQFLRVTLRPRKVFDCKLRRLSSLPQSHSRKLVRVPSHFAFFTVLIEIDVTYSNNCCVCCNSWSNTFLLKLNHFTLKQLFFWKNCSFLFQKCTCIWRDFFNMNLADAALCSLQHFLSTLRLQQPFWSVAFFFIFFSKKNHLSKTFVAF